MNEKFIVSKERRHFGRQLLLADQNELLFSAPTNAEHRRNFILRNPSDQQTQLTPQMALSVCNTDNVRLLAHGVNHVEGGWPKDINIADPEQTVRYKKKIEREDGYVAQVGALTRQMEHYVKQNSAVNLYEHFFEAIPPIADPTPFTMGALNVFRDPNAASRAVTRISWSHDGTQFVGAYSTPSFLAAQASQPFSHVWHMENPVRPLRDLRPPSAATCIEFNHKDTVLMGGGLCSGQVALWDTRTGCEPFVCTEREVSHRESVTAFLWTTVKPTNEFFSGSADGAVLWWDTRNLSEPIDTLLADPERTDTQERIRAHGIAALEFEPTIPTRFMIGTQHGLVMSCNKKSQLPSEKINVRVRCHNGAVNALERNPVFLKNYLTIGDWSAKVWSEECKDNPIVWTHEHAVRLRHAAWSRTRCSVFFVSRADGVLDAWDLLARHDAPCVTLHITHKPLNTIAAHGDGKFLAVGSASGDIYLVAVSDNLTYNERNDKALFIAMMERETRREKVLEGRLREILLKTKEEAAAAVATDGTTPIAADSLENGANTTMADVEDEFMRIVENERKKRDPIPQDDATPTPDQQ